MILLRLALFAFGGAGFLAVLFMNGTNDKVFREWKLAGAFGLIALMAFV